GRSGARDHPVARRGVHRPPRERGLPARWPSVGGARGGRHGRGGVRPRERPGVAALPRGGPRAVRGHPHRHGRVPVREHHPARAAGRGRAARARRRPGVDLRVGVRERARGSRPSHRRGAWHAGGRAAARAGVGDGAAGRAAAARRHGDGPGRYRRVSALHRGGAAGYAVPAAREWQGEGQLPLARRPGRRRAGASVRRRGTPQGSGSVAGGLARRRAGAGAGGGAGVSQRAARREFVTASALLRRDSWTTRRVLGALLLVLLLLVLWQVSLIRGSKETVVHSDFGAFWLQGYYFLTGRPLFDLPPGVRGPAYPPFAAMVFQLFALLPLPLSAAMLYLVNVLLVPVSVYITRTIFDALHPERNRAAWPLVAAVLLSFQFFLNNMNLIQVNEIILVLCLLGMQAYVARKDGWAAAAFVTAAAIKLVPAVFVAWLVVRGRRRAALAVIPAAAACVALPVAFRGMDQGVRDLTEYHAKVLGQFERGHVISHSTNQNLGALVYRLTVSAPDGVKPNYRTLF